MTPEYKTRSKAHILMFVLGMTAGAGALSVSRLLFDPLERLGANDADVILRGALYQAADDSRYALMTVSDALDDPAASRMTDRQVNDCLERVTTYARSQNLLKPDESFIAPGSSGYARSVLEQAKKVAGRPEYAGSWQPAYVHSVIAQVMSDRWMDLHGYNRPLPALPVAERERDAARDLSWSVRAEIGGPAPR